MIRSATQRNMLPRVVALACCFVAICSATDRAAARPRAIHMSPEASGMIVQTPSDVGYSKRTDLRVQVDSRWSNNYGYRPLRVQITSRQPTKSEHRITFRLHMSAWEWPALEVEQSFDMPKGATEVEAIIRCPQFHTDARCSWDVWIDGVRDRELCADEEAAWNLNAAGNQNSIGGRLKFVMVGPASRSHRLIGANSGVLEALSLPIAELPADWIDYSGVDVVALSPEDLATLEKSRPAALTALRRWVRTGGQLWVHPAGAEWQAAVDVERLLELTAPAPNALTPPLDNPGAPGKPPIVRSDADRAVIARGWMPILISSGNQFQRVTAQHIPTGRVRMIRDPSAIARLKLDPDYVIAEEPVEAAVPANNRADAAETAADADSAPWYLQRAAGLGMVRIFRGKWDPVGFSMSWRMLGGGRPGPMGFAPAPDTPVTAAIDSTRDWQSRHGMSPEFSNADFADFLVPGVGLAPVTEFRVLITMFVLVIGPLNYWLLMRANRLHLLLVTVPALAIALTSTLFGYALLSDGLATTARVRSFTTLDQTTGEAASWARLSYYAGLAPGHGLTLSDDAVIYPILAGWDQTGGNSTNDARELKWREGRQQLTAGWLRSRVPTQYLSIRARKSPHRLRLEPNGERMSATNELGTKITYIAVIDDAGKVFAGESIDAGATVELKPSTHADALRQLREMMLKNQPEMPAELIGDRSSESSPRRRRRRAYGPNFDPEFGAERLAENLQSLAIASLVEANAESILNVPPRSYVAITETGPEVELGSADAEEDASFHVLLGKW